MTFITDEILSEGGITATTISATTYLNLTSSNLASVQARRTTGFNLNIFPAFITLDATDLENQPSVIEHDNSNTERIYVYSTGLYLIHYHCDVGPGTVSDFEFFLTKNLLTTLDGSLIQGKNSSTDKVTAGVDVLVLLNGGDYVSLNGRYIGSSSGIANNVVLSVTKMEGVVGPQGLTGPQGPEGTGLFTGGTINNPTEFTAGLTANTISGGTIYGDGSNITNVSSSPLSGTIVLIDTDETETTGTGNNGAIKTYTLGSNTYSRIMIESECGFRSNANTNGIVTFNIEINNVVVRNALIEFDATGAGDQHAAGYTLKYSQPLTAGGTIDISTTSVANGTWTVESLRIYGVI
jgi:hypothetical protein